MIWKTLCGVSKKLLVGEIRVMIAKVKSFARLFFTSGAVFDSLVSGKQEAECLTDACNAVMIDVRISFDCKLEWSQYTKTSLMLMSMYHLDDTVVRPFEEIYLERLTRIFTFICST